jgi:hypothetical protein
MQNVFSRRPNHELSQAELESLKSTEWLVTNGLGGYASGTIGGSLTRVFHGYLISALPSPWGRKSTRAEPGWLSILDEFPASSWASSLDL